MGKTKAVILAILGLLTISLFSLRPSQQETKVPAKVLRPPVRVNVCAANAVDGLHCGELEMGMTKAQVQKLLSEYHRTDTSTLADGTEVEYWTFHNARGMDKEILLEFYNGRLTSVTQ